MNRRTGKRTEMVYTTCKYVPEELLRGFGEQLARLDPNPEAFTCADSCGHPNLCGFAKAVIEAVHAGNIRELIITDCCDAMRRTYDVLLREHLDFLYFLPVPHCCGEREIGMFAEEIRRLKRAYESYSGKIFSPEEMVKAVREHTLDGELEQGEYISIMGAHGGSLLLSRCRELLPDLPIRDETCTGNRTFRASEVPENAGEDVLLSWYARKLLCDFMPCLRMVDARKRKAMWTGKHNPRKGIVYHTIKFCDYYSFEYEEMKNSAVMPVLKIETDTTPQSAGQLETRIEAFGETLGVKVNKGATRAEKGIIAGIDSGSTSTDVVIMDKNQTILSSVILPTGMSASRSAQEALQKALEEASLTARDLDGVVATGYGRDILEMEKQTITEITCHARGARFLFPDVRTIIDIGGQDSKVIRIDETGAVQNFVMNDKCAAGTGRFLEMQARALGLTMEEMSRLGLEWKQDVQISSMCTVFAESEVVSLVARDTAVEDIIHGLNRSVAAKTLSLVRRGKGESPYAMTGGVSLNQGVVRCLEEALGSKVATSAQSQLCGAIGAALLGLGI